MQWYHLLGVHEVESARSGAQLMRRLEGPGLPCANTCRGTATVVAAQKLLSDGHGISRATRGRLGSVGAHPAQAASKLVHSLLHLPTRGLVVLCNLLVPASIL